MRHPSAPSRSAAVKEPVLCVGLPSCSHRAATAATTYAPWSETVTWRGSSNITDQSDMRYSAATVAMSRYHVVVAPRPVQAWSPYRALRLHGRWPTDDNACD